MSESQRSSKPYRSSAGHVFGDQVSNCGRASADMECPYLLFYVPIGLRPTCVLAQVFGPCFDKETLDKPTWLGGVVKEIPADRSVAPAHPA